MWRSLVGSVYGFIKRKTACNSSNAIFKFGNGRSIKSNRKVEIPVIIEDIPVLLTTDVISFEIPLLLSKESMKRANTVIDFKNEYVELFGKKINLFFTSSGHYCIPIKDITKNLETFNDVNNVLNLNCTSDKNEKKNEALKLHCEFGHHNYKKIVDLLKDTEVNDKQLEEELKKVDYSCEICLRYKKSRPRPIVGLSMAKSFNETVGMDLKQWSSNPPVWFLHLVDHATGYSSSCVIYTKKKEEIVRNYFSIGLQYSEFQINI